MGFGWKHITYVALWVFHVFFVRYHIYDPHLLKLDMLNEFIYISTDSAHNRYFDL